MVQINPLCTNVFFLLVYIIHWNGSLYILRGLQNIISKIIAFLSPNIDFICLRNSADAEMPHYVGTHCLL